MRRKFIIAVLGLACLSVLAITPYISLFGPTSLPTDPIGFGAGVWYEPSRPSGYTTNGGLAILKNLTSPTTNLDLIVGEGSSAPTIVAGKNGLSALGFKLSTFLVNSLYNTTANTQEVFFVWSATNASASVGFAGISAPISNHTVIVGGGLVQMKSGSASAVLCASAPESKFYVLDCVYTGLNSTGFTNGVQGSASFNLTSTNMGGITLGNGHAISLLSLFAFPNRVLTTAERALAYWYCTNRFGVMP